METPLTLRSRRLAGLMVLVAVLFAAGARGAETLRYEVSYRGVLSLGEELPIADLQLQTRSIGGAGLLEQRLEASSSAYPTVEAIYPIRYRARNWSTAGRRLVGFETYEKTRRERHRLYLPDASERGVKRLDADQGPGRQALDALETGRLPAPSAADEALFDRLGLLAHVRRLGLEAGAEYRFPVTDGRERLVYRIRVESAQTLELAGHRVPAWKVRFDGLSRDRNGRTSAVHRPLFVWFSQTPEHTPLRADSRHAVGRFQIRLQPESLVRHLARLER